MADISLLERFPACKKEAAKYRNIEIIKEEEEVQRTRDAPEIIRTEKKTEEI